jgi:hypothetical protein
MTAYTPVSASHGLPLFGHATVSLSHRRQREEPTGPSRGLRVSDCGSPVGGR